MAASLVAHVYESMHEKNYMVRDDYMDGHCILYKIVARRNVSCAKHSSSVLEVDRGIKHVRGSVYRQRTVTIIEIDKALTRFITANMASSS